MTRKFSRMEANKEVRRVMNRHGADLMYAQYSVSGLEIRITGWLCKHDNSNFNATQIEAMIQDFKRFLEGYTICGDLDNWKFSSNHIRFIGEKAEGEEDELTIVSDSGSSEYDDVAAEDDAS